MDLVSQNLLLSSGGKKDSTFVDDVFSTYLYKGTATESGNTGQIITNGIDLAGEGGMSWIKGRTNTNRPAVVDTVRGAGKMLATTEASAETAADLTGLASFNSDGFTLGNESGGYQRCNMNNVDYASWSFRKATGFFDVVTYTGNGSDRTISHSLGSVPGMIMVKQTSSANEWAVYHRSLDTSKYLMLDGTSPALTSGGDYWNNTAATATHFSVGAVPSAGNGAHRVNTNGETYVAYLFAGGSSNNSVARSVQFTAHSNWMVSTSSDYSPGTGDFTMESWVSIDSVSSNTTDGIFQLSSTSGAFTYGGIALLYKSAKRWEMYGADNTNVGSAPVDTTYTYGDWAHVAIVKTGGYLKLYVNGKEVLSGADSRDYSGYQYLGLGCAYSHNYSFNGRLSNFKYTKGQALYTSNFTPSNQPLTTTSQGSTASNVKILCCNNSSVTGATVAAGSLSTSGTVTASQVSPLFPDLESFQFGEGGDQNIVATGSYMGNGSSTGPEINLGWEPQWVMVKRTEDTGAWTMFDAMRGIPTDGNDGRLNANVTDAEVTSANWLDLTPTGFKLKTAYSDANSDEDPYVYIAIRRPDGYVGKPAEAGTDVFNQAYGANSGDFRFTSGFPVDFGWAKLYAGSGNWWTSARLIQGREVKTNNTDAGQAGTNKVFDSNVGWHAPNADNTYISHMWKRHAGFDVVTDKGNGQTTKTIAHGLGIVPEMIWRKNRDGGSDNWQVYHIGLNGGTNPYLWRIYLDTSGGQSNDQWTWDSAPTATHFTVGSNGAINRDGDDFITMLFASVAGISKVGYYDGSDSAQTITTGFQPRFLFIKAIDTNREWTVLDTTRGWGVGNDKRLFFDDGSAQNSDENVGAPTSTGFTLDTVNSRWNSAAYKYIYYAHA